MTCSPILANEDCCSGGLPGGVGYADLMLACDGLPPDGLIGDCRADGGTVDEPEEGFTGFSGGSSVQRDALAIGVCFGIDDEFGMIGGGGDGEGWLDESAQSWL